MRISDWSSDVCSSDLRPGNALTVDVNKLLFAGVDFHGRVQQTAAGPFAGALDFSGSGLNGRMQLAAAGDVQRADINARVCGRSEEHTSELQALMRISYAVIRLKKKNNNYKNTNQKTTNKRQ